MTRYGSHPDFVFGVHYGFVPPLLEQRGSCYTVLRFDQALRGGGSSGAGGGSVGGGGGSVGSSVGGGGDGAACGVEEGLGIEEGLGAEAVREAQLASEASSDGEPGWCEWSEAEVRHSTCMPLTAHACVCRARAVRRAVHVPCMCPGAAETCRGTVCALRRVRLGGRLPVTTLTPTPTPTPTPNPNPNPNPQPNPNPNPNANPNP